MELPDDWFEDHDGQHLVLNIQKVETEIERLRAALFDARLALDLALMTDGFGPDIKKRLRTTWLKVGDALMLRANEQNRSEHGHR